MHHYTFQKLIDHPDTFTFKTVFQIASLVGVDKGVMINIVFKQTQLEEKTKRKLKP
jgi:hypothetical protein